ncbi:helix-hairpin-helix domain-containing protein [Auraticoccus monumenti]|uniref:SLBB domain-containing protein n=1 Tax=Auraticoccus monumenti TaxID=675864 RepID=A0A1G7EIP8_9ACTN|nr:helix-hairpin-helix domain-containing protein [Auraticoccus monumenti]SDE63467.1 SLBB domain-containing protein [Auraticoccus monumenti]
MARSAPVDSARSEYVQARLDAILSRASTSVPTPPPVAGSSGSSVAGSATVLAARRRLPSPLLTEALGRPRRGRARDPWNDPPSTPVPSRLPRPDPTGVLGSSPTDAPLDPEAGPDGPRVVVGPDVGGVPAALPAPPREPVPPAPALPGARTDRSITLQVPQLSRRHLVVLAAVLALAVAFSAFLLLRARADSQPVVLATETTAAPAPPSESAPAASPTSVPEVVVHVLGAVAEPGVVSLPQGARVGEAIERAGGLTDDARPGELNLAQVLVDGQQVVVSDDDQPSEVRTDGGAAGGAAGGGSGGGGGSGSGPVAGGGGAQLDLNNATAAQLEGLPGVGPVTAQKILDWRTEHGRFSRVEELQEVSGIGPKSYAEIAPHVRV